MSPLRFGLIWPFRNPDFSRVPWDELYRDHLALIVESEALGFDDAWLTEHHLVDDGNSPSLFAIAQPQQFLLVVGSVRVSRETHDLHSVWANRR